MLPEELINFLESIKYLLPGIISYLSYKYFLGRPLRDLNKLDLLFIGLFTLFNSIIIGPLFSFILNTLCFLIFNINLNMNSFMLAVVLSPFVGMLWDFLEKIILCRLVPAYYNYTNTKELNTHTKDEDLSSWDKLLEYYFSLSKKYQIKVNVSTKTKNTISGFLTGYSKFDILLVSSNKKNKLITLIPKDEIIKLDIVLPKR